MSQPATFPAPRPSGFAAPDLSQVGHQLPLGDVIDEEMIAHYEQVSGREVRNPHYWEVFGAMRFCAIFIRLADRMTATGLVPAELNMAVANQVTASLAALLDIENPTPPAF